MNSLQLVQEARAGNQTAFSALLVQAEPVITYHAHRLSPCEPEDLEQHLRLVVCNTAVPRYDGRANWETWVSRVCATRGRDYLRGQPEVSGNSGDLETVEAVEGEAVDHTDRLLIRRRMRRLSDLERGAVRGWSRGETPAQIADRMGVGRNSARDAIARGKKKLRK